MEWLDYRQQLGIGINDNDKAKFFINNIFNFLGDDVGYDGEEFYKFCIMTGSSISDNVQYNSATFDIDFSKSAISILRSHSYNLRDFLSHLIALINCKKDREDVDFNKTEYIAILQHELDRARIQVDVIHDEDGVFIFPKGAEELDRELVSKPLTWLSKYPKAEKLWKRAIVDYAKATEDDASNVADGFRKALEEFFRCFFGGNKNFDGYKVEYGKYLKDHGIPAEISKNYMTLIEQYKNYNNAYAKHHDASSVKVLEYLMYQTGMLMRLLVTLEA